MEFSMHAPKRAATPKQTDSRGRPDAPKRTSHVIAKAAAMIRYTFEELRSIGDRYSKIRLPAALIDTMILYELRCEVPRHSLFKGEEFHYWQTQLQTHLQRSWRTRSDTTRSEEEYRDVASRLVKAEQTAYQIGATMNFFEDRIMELERTSRCMDSVDENGAGDTNIQSIPRSFGEFKPSFEARVDEMQRSMQPPPSRHSAKVKVVTRELETMNRASHSLWNLCDQLNKWKLDSDGVLPNHVNGFKSVISFAFWVLPHLQLLECGLMSLTSVGASDKQKEGHAPGDEEPSADTLAEHSVDGGSKSTLADSPISPDVAAAPDVAATPDVATALDVAAAPDVPASPDVEPQCDGPADNSQLLINLDSPPKYMPGGW